MTGAELKAAHHRLGLSATKAAEVLGMSDGRTVRRWWCEEREIPQLVIIVTTALLESEAVREYFGVTLSE
jgi:hypothetical protein